jgi:quinol monooxygenase YgiN
MTALFRTIVAGLAILVCGIVQDSRAQAPAQPPAPIEGNIYSVTYVEVMPTSKAAGAALLKGYRDTTRKEDGNLRCEVVQRVGLGHQFAIIEVWKDQKAFEAHAKSGNLVQTREKVAAIRNAPTDERVHIGLSVGPVDTKPARGALYVVTHVDVIPPRKDDGVAAVKALGEDSRKQDGSVRFEVVQQTNRPNHFTVVEVWKDEKVTDKHSMADTTRGFRDKLGTMTGALYDERMYKAIN